MPGLQNRAWAAAAAAAPAVSPEATARGEGSAPVCGIDPDALFHTQAPIFMRSEHLAAEAVAVVLRAEKGTITGGSLFFLEKGEEDYGPEQALPLEPDSMRDATGRFDYWKAVLPPCGAQRRYGFALHAPSGELAYLTARGLTAEKPEGKKAVLEDRLFVLSPEFFTPDWCKGAVLYSVLTNAFFNGDLLNDPTHTDSVLPSVWGTKNTDGESWYGGDLEGLRQRLDYIREELGADILYTNPTFDTTHNAGYGQTDYTTITPQYGTNEDYRRLIEEAHARGMHVINDGVYLYQWAGSRYLNEGGRFPGGEGALERPDSPWHGLLYWKEEGWPSYLKVFFDSVPKLNFNNEVTRDLIIRRPDSAMQYFLREPYNLDGWRLDVPQYDDKTYGGMEAMKLMRAHVKGIDSDKVLIEECGPDDEVFGGAMDAKGDHLHIMACVRRLLGGKADYWNPEGMEDGESGLLRHISQRLHFAPWQASACNPVMLSNHDNTRIAYNLGEDQSAIERAIAIQMTMVGTPYVYYGDEIGMTQQVEGNRAAMDCFNWNRAEWNYATLHTYKSFFVLRKAYPEVFRDGAFIPLAANDTERLLAYGRFTAGQACVLAVNNGGTDAVLELPLYRVNLPDGTLVVDWESGVRYRVAKGVVNAAVRAGGYAVLVAGGPVESGYTPTHREKAAFGGTTGFVQETEGTLLVHAPAGVCRFVGEGLIADGVCEALVEVPAAGTAGLTMQATLVAGAPFAMAAVGGGKLRLLCRTEADGIVQEIACLPCEETAVTLQLVREKNVFTALADGKPFGSVAAALPAAVHAGVAIAAETPVRCEALTVRPMPTVRGDRFDGPVPASIWRDLPAGGWRIGSGCLHLRGDRLLSALPAPDWTAHTVIRSAEGRAGLLCEAGQGQRACLLLETKDNGFTAVLQVQAGGLLTERRTVITAADTQLYLIKIGRYVRGLVGDGESWQTVGEPLPFNIADGAAGLLAEEDASFACFEYGAALAGGEGTVYLPTLTAAPETAMPRRLAPERYRYGVGDWAYADAGYIQKSLIGHGEMFVDRPLQVPFMVDVTVDVRGEGSAGLGIGERTLRLDSRGGVRLEEKGVILAAAAPAPALSPCGMRLQWLEDPDGARVLRDGTEILRVSSGMAAALGLRLVTDEAQAAFRNIRTAVFTRPAFENLTWDAFNADGDGVVSRADGYGMATFAGLAASRLTLAFTAAPAWGENGWFGVGLFGQIGRYPTACGWHIRFEEKTISLYLDGERLQSVELHWPVDQARSVQITAGGELVVCAGGVEMRHPLPVCPGGGVVLDTYNTAVRLDHITVTNPDDD